MGECKNSTCARVENSLNIDFLGVDQSYIDLILQEYSALRSMYGRLPVPFLISKVQLANILAQSMNTTLASTCNMKSFQDDNLTPTTVHPDVLGGRIYETWKNLSDHFMQERISVTQFESVAHNFVYCGISEIQQESLSFLIYFTWPVWICLIISIISVSYMVRIYIDKEQGKPKFCQRSVTMATLSILLSPGISGLTKRAKISKLFILWTMCSVIIGTYYTGAFTSKVIEPPEDKQMKKIEELGERNYTLIFQRQQFLDDFYHLLEINRNLHSFVVLEKLSKNLIFERDRREYVKMLAEGVGFAVVSNWIHVIYEYGAAMRDMPNKKQRSCYIGKELAFPEHTYYLITPPKSELFGKKLRIIFEAGFYQIWVNTFLPTYTGGRGAINAKSPTQIVEEKEGPEALELEGKLRYVFFLWSVAIGCSSIIFSWEVVGYNFLLNFVNMLKQLC